MNLPFFVYVYFFLSYEGNSAQADILASRHLFVCVLICDCPFPEEYRLYKLELNLDTIGLILQSLLHGGMACLSIFGGGILTYLCMVCYYESQIYFHVQGLLTISESELVSMECVGEKG
jgi:hypothetical protein